MSRGEGFKVKIPVAGHVKPLKVHAGPDDRHVSRPGLLKPPGGARHVASPGVGNHHRCGKAAVLAAALLGDLPADGLDSGDAQGRVEGCIEEARLLKNAQQIVKKLRPHAGLDDLCAVGLALAGLLHYLRLAPVPAVEDLLGDDRLKVVHIGLGDQGCPVVAARGGGHSFEALRRREMARQGRPTVLEAPGRVGGLVLHQDPGPLAPGRQGPGRPGQVVQLHQRGVSHVGGGLNRPHPVEVVPKLAHHTFVIECQGSPLELFEIHEEGFLHNLVPSCHNPFVGAAHRSSSQSALRASPSPRNSVT